MITGGNNYGKRFIEEYFLFAIKGCWFIGKLLILKPTPNNSNDDSKICPPTEYQNKRAVLLYKGLPYAIDDP